MKIVLFFTFDISLAIWSKSGLLQREIRIYQDLIRVHGIQVQFLTYGDKSDREFEEILGDIELFPIYERMPKHKRKMLRILQSFFIPWVFRNELKETDVLYKKFKICLFFYEKQTLLKIVKG
jgi:hypothetical protein